MTRSLPSAANHQVSPSLQSQPKVTYEWRTITIPQGATRNETRELLTEKAEYGRWELARTQVYIGGARKVSLRRRVIRVERSDMA